MAPTAPQMGTTSYVTFVQIKAHYTLFFFFLQDSPALSFLIKGIDALQFEMIYIYNILCLNWHEVDLPVHGRAADRHTVRSSYCYYTVSLGSSLTGKLMAASVPDSSFKNIICCLPP